ncbi:Peroxisomal acyl-coenzyme A oxidase 1 [Cucurbita argyrosperma subsp. argyrosperma]|nr:Peroxisomal acyl-coenzyme A oxidase 1 [Cucurbita argyrosperma subsp. argyrosperma]
MEGVDHLAHERNSAQFDVDEMKIVWAGSRHAYEVSDRMSRLVANDPAFRKDSRAQLTRKELFKNTLRKATYAWKRILELKLSGLETTATFDPKTDEFVIHSPTLTSSKWWPGGLGKVSTHAVVFARLITDGRDYGVHGFMVQIRSLDDHSVLPGITIGDIVTREGKYVQSDAPRQLVYGTMVFVRKAISAFATRYSAVRRQFGSQDGVETQVINYKTQQSRLFPLLASAYAFRFVGEWLQWLYTDVTQRLAASDFSTLPEAHACTAGLKSITTAATADGIEECRKLCGGHGYLCSSGLPELFAVYVPACTYEGDNVVLLLQVARFLVKTVSQLASGKKPVGTTAYMGRLQHLMESSCKVQKAEDWLNPSVVLEVFEARSARMSVECAKRLSEYIEKLQGDIPGKGIKEQLQILCSVYALYTLHKHKGDFLSTSTITPKQASLADDQLRSLYSQVRPNAIALVDAFNYTDHYLGSILGRYDGNVYPNLYDEAWKDPLNDSAIPDGYHEYIKPLLKQQLRNARL